MTVSYMPAGAEKLQSHPLKLGDVLYASWGYDQTNIDFYEVVKVGAKTVGVRGLKQVRTCTDFMQGTCVPATGEDRFLDHRDVLDRDKILTRRVRISQYDGKPRINAHSDYASAQLWDGKPKDWSSYA